MLKNRIIPCLDICNGRTVKGINFLGLADAGDPVELAKYYADQGADELVFLDITATVEKRKTLVSLVEKIASGINIPFTVGGGINTTEDVRNLLNAGADKVAVNSSAVLNPGIITLIAKQFGCQCVVVATDVDYIDGQWIVYINGGRTATGLKAEEWAIMAEESGAGEILVTSMAHDGTKKGFALDLLNIISGMVKIPVIASGGAGANVHFRKLFETTGCTAALAASVFHFREISIPDLKKYLKTNNISIR